MFAAISRSILCLAVCALASANAVADDGKEIATDRPDFVESSDVVPKGMWQIETSLNWERNTQQGANDRSFATPTLLRFGFANNLEFRIETDGRVWQRTDDGTGSVRTNGWADTSLGLKWHFMDGKDSTPSAALLFHADLDSGSDGLRGNGIRPSIRLVAEWDLPDDMSLGIMPGLMFDKNADGKRFTSGIFGIVVGKEWSKTFRSFVEVSLPQITGNSNGGTQANLTVGGAWLLSDNVQLDTALSRGLNKRTPSWNWTVGLSMRF
ncbi:transporter [Massilia sp. W12]|uniref:transporter n=1 Tax=Massilia sp. W12 TaxID=3126507 RepID=UPI0030D619A7